MKLLTSLYKVHAPSRKEADMITFLDNWLRDQGLSPTIDEKGNILVTKGVADTYPCIVAHIDEVHHTRAEDYKVCQCDDVLYGFSASGKGQVGIGADDKNGIWVALNAIKKLKVLKVAFFTGEEIGCLGSAAVDMSFFGDCRFVLQCDRKGGSDFINNASGVQLCTKEFVDLMDIKKYGYKVTSGMMTDVMELRRNGLEICAANLSCGYYNPHTDRELTVMSELRNCLNMVLAACKNITEVQPIAKYEPPKVTVYPSSSWDSYDYGRGWTSTSKSSSGVWSPTGNTKSQAGCQGPNKQVTTNCSTPSRWNFDYWQEQTILAFARGWEVGEALDVLQGLDLKCASKALKDSITKSVSNLKRVPVKSRGMTLEQAFRLRYFSVATVETVLSFIDNEYIQETQVGGDEYDYDAWRY